ncbi:g11487 [Coccomyxa viridis]|uniref:G11487 protein n=1 Tax=Coccomyxa viridis TaxID=1274662 RepID=A0ABP1GDR4_9CHLO
MPGLPWQASDRVQYTAGPSESLHYREAKALKVLIKWPKWTRWVSHLAFYTGEGKDLELLDVVPVNWWTGKAKLNFEKLKGHGKTSEDPLLVESRYKTIFDVVGLGSLDLVIGKMEVMGPSHEIAEAKQAATEEAEAQQAAAEEAEAEVPLSEKAKAEESAPEKPEAEEPPCEEAEAKVPAPEKAQAGLPCADEAEASE